MCPTCTTALAFAAVGVLLRYILRWNCPQPGCVGVNGPTACYCHACGWQYADPAAYAQETPSATFRPEAIKEYTGDYKWN